METLDSIIDRHAKRPEPKPVVFFSTCYGCDAPMLEGEEYRKDFCSSKCYCETSSIDREDG